jgi:DNA-binding NarL/FixJ family response regulator
MHGVSRKAVRQTMFELDGHQYIVVCLEEATDEKPIALGQLTRIEREVAAQVAEGLSSYAIAAMRRRSIRTVENQVAAIFRKLHVGSRAELVVALSGSD